MSRNSSVVLIALALLVVIGAGGVFFAMRDEVTGGIGSNQEACDLLTLDEAKILLNDTAKKSTSSEVRTKETDNLKITDCNYETQGSGLSDIWTVNLEVRSAKTGAGAADNASYFPPNNTEGQQVAGYGDEALWDAYSGELTVLQDNNFYLISMKKGFNGNTVTLSDVQQAAEAVGIKD